MALDNAAYTSIKSEVLKEHQRFDTIQLARADAYIQAIRAVATDATGQIDYKKLDDPVAKQTLYDRMMSSATAQAQTIFQHGATIDDSLKHILATVVLGVQPEVLLQYVNQGSKFDYNSFSQVNGQITQQQKAQYAGAWKRKVSREDMESAITYMGLDTDIGGSGKKVDIKKVGHDEVLRYLERYYLNGTIGINDIDQSTLINV